MSNELLNLSLIKLMDMDFLSQCVSLMCLKLWDI